MHASAHHGAPLAQVRFVSAPPTDMRATFGVELAALRPGWLYKNGRWAGHWQPKVKSKRMLEREAYFEKLKLAWPVGMQVEVEQTDGSLQGSVFEGEVVGHEFDSKVWPLMTTDDLPCMQVLTTALCTSSIRRRSFAILSCTRAKRRRRSFR